MKRTKIAPTLHAHVIGGHEAYPDDEEYARACRELRALLAVARAAEARGEGAMRMKWWEWIAFMLIWLSHRPLRHPTMRTKDPGVVWCPDCLRTYRARRGGKA